MFYFHHVLVACVFSSCHFEKNSGHKCHIWVVSLLDEFLSYAFSNFSEGKFFGCKKTFKFFSSFHDHQQYVSLNCSLQKNLVTNITFEWFVRIVDRSSVFWQIALLRKTLVTNITFEQFLSLFMYFRNMFFHSLFFKSSQQINLWMDL